MRQTLNALDLDPSCVLLLCAPRLRDLLLGITSRPQPQHFRAGAPPLLVELATRRLKPQTTAVATAAPTAATAAATRRPLLSPLYGVFGAAPPMQQYALAKALSDSGKLLALDALLARLKAEGHKVLIFAQVGPLVSSLGRSNIG